MSASRCNVKLSECLILSFASTGMMSAKRAAIADFWSDLPEGSYWCPRHYCMIVAFILLRPHPRGNVLLFLADGIGVDRRGGELGVSHPLRQHVQRNSLHSGIDAKPVAQALGAAMRRVGDTRLDHHALDDLPDSYAGQGPDRSLGTFGRPLSLSDAVRGVQGIEILGRDGNGPVDDPGPPCPVFPLLETAERDRPAREIDAGRRNLDQLRGTASGMVQRLAERPVAGGTLAGDIEEGGALLGVEVQPVAVAVVEAHLAHFDRMRGKR